MERKGFAIAKVLKRTVDHKYSASYGTGTMHAKTSGTIRDVQ